MGDTSVKETWQSQLACGVKQTLQHFSEEMVARDTQQEHAFEHFNKTPERYVKAIEEIFSGCLKNPAEELSTLFESNFDQMIHVEDVEFFSMCAHHLLLFTGKVHFAYIPDRKIVGLSKIPRLIDMYASRPQIQEEMAEQIVDAFQDIVNPQGCGVYIRATHFCCSARGVKKSCFMKTTALRGCFKNQSTKSEFLQAIR